MDEQINTPTEEVVEPQVAAEVPSEAPVEPVAETSAPEGEVVLGASSDGGVIVEPTPVIQ